MKYDTLLIKCHNHLTGHFMQELQKGFYVLSKEGKTIHLFLTEDCGISDDYISSKVKTIFINGEPVDDIFNIQVKENGVCALSGAMPGIVGAMMRAGSPYATMRKSISARPDNTVESGKKIILKLKIFNTILFDMGINFLKKGILLKKNRIIELFLKHGKDIYADCREIILNDSIIQKEEIIENLQNKSDELVLLKIETDHEN